MKKVFYLSYDSLVEDISNSQILPYLKFFSKNYKIDVFSFEKKKYLKKFFSLKKNLSDYNINSFFTYYYNGKNILYIFHLLKAIIYINYKIFTKKYEIIHIRSLMPCLFIMPSILFIKSNIIFDIRGFWIDEKVDRYGLKKNSYKYFFFKYLEKYILNISKSIICLTHHSKNIIIKKYNISKKKISVIPTCVDTNYFKSINQNELSDFTKIVYLGSTKGAYNISKILSNFKSLISSNKNYYLTIITKDDHIELKNKFIKADISNTFYKIISLDRNEIVEELSYNDIGVFYLNENFSIQASFPTKIAEFLSLGIPIICNNFNEDINFYINKHNVGKIYNYKEDLKNNFNNIIDKIKSNKNIKENCRNLAKQKLSLDYSFNKYQKIYDNLK